MTEVGFFRVSYDRLTIQNYSKILTEILSPLTLVRNIISSGSTCTPVQSRVEYPCRSIAKVAQLKTGK